MCKGDGKSRLPFVLLAAAAAAGLLIAGGCLRRYAVGGEEFVHRELDPPEDLAGVLAALGPHGFGFNNSDVTVFCGTGDSSS